MNRRLLVFFILVNALVSLAIALTVVWIAEQRRPGLEEMVLQPTPAPAAVLIATSAPTAPASAPPQATPTATPAPTETGETEIYVVKAGDSLLAIAARFGVTQDTLMEVNDLADPNFVYVGQRLVIPVSPERAGGPADGGAGLPQRGLQLRIESAGVLGAEAVQVVNDTDGAVDLQGWSLSREGGPIYTFASTLLFPGSGVHLYTGAGQDNSLNRYWGRTEAAWQNGATVVLRNPGGNLITQITVVSEGQ